jgi:glycine/D-amino acid oxidase-like deaminating enzyme
MIYGEKWAVAYAAVTEHPDPPPALRDGIGGEQANHNAAHIATWNPAHSLRWIEWAEEVADRHMPALGNDLLIWCWACNRSPDFCAELAGLASALDIEVTG